MVIFYVVMDQPTWKVQQAPPISSITCRLTHTFAKIMEISHESKKWFGQCSYERNHPISLWEEEDKGSFTPPTKDSMNLTLFFAQLNLCPCVAESISFKYLVQCCSLFHL